MIKLKFPDSKTSKLAWKGDIPITNRYTSGVAGQKFFQALKEEEKILGTVCNRCDITYVPMKLFCERCFAELNETVDVGDTGKLVSFSVVHLDLDGKKVNPPQMVGLIELGNSQAKIVHLLGEVKPTDLRSGLTVKAVWKMPLGREGKITDIQYFKPL